MTFHVEARRVNAHGSVARCQDAEIALDTDLAGNPKAFNPAELLLAALAACIIKGIKWVTPMLHFPVRRVEARVDGARQDVPPRMESIAHRTLDVFDRILDVEDGMIHSRTNHQNSKSTP